MFKIYQNDGGGLRGCGSAIIPAYVELMSGSRMNNLFQFFSGTSVGSILCALYAAGVPAGSVAKMLEQEGANLFVEKGFFERLRDPNKAKYHRKFLYERIEKELNAVGVSKMKDLKSKLAITAFGLYANKTHYICSWDPAYAELKIVDVVAWSALSAANYFGKIVVPDFKWTNRYQVDAPQDMAGEVFQDGGQGIHNSTAEDALITALFGLGWLRSIESVYMLSVGCGSQRLVAPSLKSVADDGWVKQIMNYMSQARGESTCDQIESSAFMLKKFNGNSEHFCRIDPVIPAEIDVLDGKKFVNKYIEIFNGLTHQIPQWVLRQEI